MSLLAVIRRDVGSKFAGELLSRTLFLLFFFYVGRRIGSTNFGTLNLAISTATILGAVFLDLGLNISAVQLLVSEHDRPDQQARIASTILTARLILYLPLCVALLGVSRFLIGGTIAFSLLLIASLYVLATHLLEYFSAITSAFHRMDIEAALKVFNRGTAVALGYFAVKYGHVAAILWVLTGSMLLSCTIAVVVLNRRLVRVRFAMDWPLLKRTLWVGLPVAGTLIVGTIYLKWDLLVLSYYKIGKEQIGWYAGAFKIVEAFSAMPMMLGTALFPMMIQLRKSNADALNRLLNTSTKAVLLFSIPVAASVSLLSKQIIGRVYGPSYLPGASILAVLIWCIVPIFVYLYLMFANVASGYATHNLVAGIVALLAGLTVNVILVPRIGYIGAAWAALAANSSFALLAMWRVCITFRRASIPRTVVQLVTAGTAMVLTGLYCPMPLAFQLMASIVAFMGVLLATRALGTEDFSLLVRMVQMRVQPKAQQP